MHNDNEVCYHCCLRNRKCREDVAGRKATERICLEESWSLYVAWYQPTTREDDEKENCRQRKVKDEGKLGKARPRCCSLLIVSPRGFTKYGNRRICKKHPKYIIYYSTACWRLLLLVSVGVTDDLRQLGHERSPNDPRGPVEF